MGGTPDRSVPCYTSRTVLTLCCLIVTLRPPPPPQVTKTLGDQTTQLNKIVDDLNEIEMDVKKARKIIGDITRGLLTDK